MRINGFLVKFPKIVWLFENGDRKMEETKSLAEKTSRRNFNNEGIFLNAKRLGSLCKIIADHFAVKAKKEGRVIDAVVGQPVMASFVAYWLAEKDPSGHDVLVVYATKKEISHGQEGTSCVNIEGKYRRHVKGRMCAVVWDTIETEEVTDVCAAVYMMMGDVLGVGGFRNEKKGVTAEFLGVPGLFCAINGGK